MLPESLHPYFTALTLILMVGCIVSGRLAIDLAILGSLLAFLLAGVLTPAEAVHGYGSTALITIAFLYIVAGALRQTGAITAIGRRLIGRPKSALAAQIRYVPFVAVVSGFANNTPLVAAFIPMLGGVARRSGIPISHLLMPLSFAAILGGVCTLVGTSTNLVVAGLLDDARVANPGVDIPEFGMLTLTPIGLPVAVVGITYILIVGRWLLPRQSFDATDPQEARRYMAAVRVAASSPVVGRTIEQADLRGLPGLFLSRIERGDQSIRAPEPEAELLADDVLVFVGRLESLRDVLAIRGLVPAADEIVATSSRPADGEQYRPNLRLYEAVVSAGSPLIGRTIRGAELRSRYDAVVVAVQRLGHRLEGKIGDIRLRPGDTLLLESGPGFLRHFRDSREFDLVSEADEAATPRHERARLSIGIFVAFVVILLVGLIHTMVAAMLAAGLMVLTRCIRASQARTSVDWQVLIIIGGAFGLGTAMERSGLGAMIAQGLGLAADGLGPAGLLALTYAATVCLTAIVTHAAAAILVFPIVFQAASDAGYSIEAFAVCIAIAASLEFTTPMGYQTNLMVMGPGGYRFMDYVRFGGPLTILAGCTAVATCVLWFNL